MHELLEKQLIEYFGSTEAIPQEFKDLFEKVGEVYTRIDQSDSEIKLRDLELQQSETKYRTLIENSTDIMTILDDQGVIQYQSPSIERVFGYENNELVGTNLIDIVHPDDKRNATRSFLITVKNPGEYTNFDFRAIGNNGEYRIIESVGVNSPNEEGKPQVYISSRDITTRRKTEEIQVSQTKQRTQQISTTNIFAQDISDVKDIGELYKQIIKSIVENLEVDYAQLFRYNPVTDNLLLVSGSGEVGIKLQQSQYQIPIHQGVIGRSAGNKAPVLITNTTIEPNWKPTPNLEQTKSQLSTPIFLGIDLIGIIDIQSNHIDYINEDTRVIMGVLSSLAAVSIESIRLRTEMEERLRELDTLQKITVREGWESHQDIANISSNTYTYDLISGQTVPVAEPPTENIHSNLLTVRGETIGKLAIKEDENNPITDDEKSLIDAISEEVAEALERARLFETSQRSAAELAILNEMGNAFTEELDPTPIIENIYIFASRLLEIEDFYVALYDDEKNVITFPLAFEDDHRITPEHPHWDNWQPRELGDSGGLTGHIIKTREPILIERNAEEILEKIGIQFQRHGNLTQSWLGVPLTVGDRVIGIVSCQSEDTPGLYNKHHQELLTAIASQAAVAIDNALRFTEEQERAEQERLVRTITDEVRRGADVDAIMRIALEQLSSALGAQESVIKLGTRDQLIAKNQETVKTNGAEKPAVDELELPPESESTINSEEQS